VAPTPLPLVVSGVVAGAAAAVLSFLALAVVALGAWMLDPTGTQEWSGMLEVASGAWLAGLGLPPTIDGVSITLLPLGFALVPAVAVYGASRWAADASAVARRSEGLVVAVTAGFAFAAVAAVIASLARSLAVPAVEAALVSGTATFLLSGLVVMCRARLIRWHGLAASARHVMGATAVALAVLVLVAAATLAIAVIANIDEITSLLVALDMGVSGVLLLAVLTLGYLPNAIIWAMAYILGPGVSISVGVTVSPYAEPSTTTLPGFPLLAVLPSGAPAGAVLLPLAGVVAGIFAGVYLRRCGQAALRGAGLAVIAAVVAGVVLASVAWLASGSLGTTTLQGLGPSPIALGLIGSALVGLGALAVAAWPARYADD
jgi:hypothetical protein